jgi:hypothetical protein
MDVIRVLPAPGNPEEPMLLIVMITVVIVGLAAIALAQPPRRPEIVVWNDEIERRLANGHKIDAGWW